VKPARSSRGRTGILVALSGPVGAGKTTLAEGLQTLLHARIFRTRDLLMQRAGPVGRKALQRIGGELDQWEGSAWVSRPALQVRLELDLERPLVVDAVRTAEQLSALRLGACVLHIHLTAADAVLIDRYELRRQIDPAFEYTPYASIRADPTELAVHELANVAQLVVDTGVLDIEETRRQVLRFLGSIERSDGACSGGGG
jgi:adenylate kinase family enzyme